MKSIKSIVLCLAVIVLVFAVGISLKDSCVKRYISSLFAPKTEIENFNFDRDSADVEALFHKGDNWYWMLHNGILHSYSVDYMLRNKSSSQYAKNNDLILKVLRIDGKLAGFLAYYPHSEHVWQILFVLVDQDFRRQGIAKKILKFAVNDMVARGARKIVLATRNNNFKAQALYKNYGFTQTHDDEQFVHFSWYVGQV